MCVRCEGVVCKGRVIGVYGWQFWIGWVPVLWRVVFRRRLGMDGGRVSMGWERFRLSWGRFWMESGVFGGCGTVERSIGASQWLVSCRGNG